MKVELYNLVYYFVCIFQGVQCILKQNANNTNRGKINFNATEEINSSVSELLFLDNETLEDTRTVIYPGTKWCGLGNIASNYNDLGRFKRVDTCCREHDKCPDYIAPFSTKYGLRNYTPVTKLLCSCDLKFFQCLKLIGSTASNNVGNIYFNNAENKCFRQDYPALRCKVSYQSSRRCKEYLLNKNQPKKYQFFDIPPY